MARTSDTATFDAKAYRDSTERMRAKGERVHDAGEQVFRSTGKLDPNVDIVGKTRVSRNSMVRQGTKYVLKNGIALPIMSGFDGTGSMGENVEKAYYAIPKIEGMLKPLRTSYNTQVASAVWQDVQDHHPVVQMSQFESDERIAEQIRLLVPDKDGGDAIEDYDLGLAYLWLATQTDLYDFYGLKGYVFIVADMYGRGRVTKRGIKQYLGHDMQEDEVTTRKICQALLEKWHVYYFQVGGGGSETKRWWAEKLGAGRVIDVPDSDYLAQVQAGAIYVTETERPTQAGLSKFLLSEESNDRRTAGNVWEWLQAAEQNFGAQTQLEGYADIPKPGDEFEHFRHAWPLKHARFAENVTPEEGKEGETSKAKAKPKSGTGKSTGKSKSDDFNWNDF